MTLLPIHVLGSEVLRKVTTPVAAVTDAIRQLIDDMFETMYAAEGIGLAAPQVGRTERLAVIDVEPTKLVIINPEIVATDGKEKAEEGCLSIPDIYGDVERPERVTVRALDRDGQSFEVEADGLLARCLQHEIDHLHGRLFIDYLGPFKRRAAMSKWEKQREKFPKYLRVLSPQEVAQHHHRPPEEL